MNVGPDDSIKEMATQAVEYDVEFPFVKDQGAKCALALGVKRTPEVAVLDSERKLLYRGRIDDQYRLGGARPKPTRHDLTEALDSILAGKKVAVEETPVDGCLITRTELPAAKVPVTFAEHVSPIVQKHCAGCHKPGTTAPFSLITYEQVSSKGNSIAEVVRDQRMPPWYGDPRHTEFIDKRGLTARERETILQWVKGGKLKGAEAKLPKMPPREENPWKIGKPDLIIQAPEHKIPDQGVIDYKYIVLPHVFCRTHGLPVCRSCRTTQRSCTTATSPTTGSARSGK